MTFLNFDVRYDLVSEGCQISYVEVAEGPALNSSSLMNLFSNFQKKDVPEYNPRGKQPIVRITHIDNPQPITHREYNPQSV